MCVVLKFKSFMPLNRWAVWLVCLYYCVLYSLQQSPSPELRLEEEEEEDVDIDVQEEGMKANIN